MQARLEMGNHSPSKPREKKFSGLKFVDAELGQWQRSGIEDRIRGARRQSQVCAQRMHMGLLECR